ncbi:hypothetical protein BHE74_00027091, partial [Ensete ventricosum]
MKFKEGDRVEVLRRKEEQYDSWFPAKISFVHSSTYTVRYELFMTSDKKSVVETVHEEDVRPCPSPVSGKKWWTAGDIVEVLDLYSWRVGKVVKVLKIDRVVIKLFGSIQLKEHSVSDLRVPQAWQNNRWIMIDQVEDILYFFSTLISPSFQLSCHSYIVGPFGLMFILCGNDYP